MERSDSTIIYLQSSNLNVQFAGNMSAVHVPSSQKVVFDAWTNSYDPDFSASNKTNLNFTFYCRRLCEQWPGANLYQQYKNWAGYNASLCTAAENVTTGCFGSSAGFNGPSISFWSYFCIFWSVTLNFTYSATL